MLGWLFGKMTFGLCHQTNGFGLAYMCQVPWIMRKCYCVYTLWYLTFCTLFFFLLCGLFTVGLQIQIWASRAPYLDLDRGPKLDRLQITRTMELCGRPAWLMQSAPKGIIVISRNWRWIESSTLTSNYINIKFYSKYSGTLLNWGFFRH